MVEYNEAEDVPCFRKWGCNISEQTGSIPAGKGKSREDGGDHQHAPSRKERLSCEKYESRLCERLATGI